MPDNLRGSRMGTTSLESVRGAVLAEAATHTYICETDHQVKVTFAADAIPRRSGPARGTGGPRPSWSPPTPRWPHRPTSTRRRAAGPARPDRPG
ncbi:RNA polymerase-binding protein RbpA [Klenkia terrae]|uniref:RNA polymerase-binding protein RbpA n=1 Tax=Klenkia terrae TaxID=1052259 RepID=UPI0036232BDA